VTVAVKLYPESFSGMFPGMNVNERLNILNKSDEHVTDVLKELLLQYKYVYAYGNLSPHPAILYSCWHASHDVTQFNLLQP
jgi:hypothetical protein